jgi:hypothetical protein
LFWTYSVVGVDVRPDIVDVLDVLVTVKDQLGLPDNVETYVGTPGDLDFVLEFVFDSYFGKTYNKIGVYKVVVTRVTRINVITVFLCHG